MIKLLLFLHAADVFNMNKRALFCKIYKPEKTFAFKKDKCVGSEKAKQKLSFDSSEYDWVTKIASVFYWKVSEEFSKCLKNF